MWPRKNEFWLQILQLTCKRYVCVFWDILYYMSMVIVGIAMATHTHTHTHQFRVFRSVFFPCLQAHHFPINQSPEEIELGEGGGGGVAFLVQGVSPSISRGDTRRCCCWCSDNGALCECPTNIDGVNLVVMGCSKESFLLTILTPALTPCWWYEKP